MIKLFKILLLLSISYDINSQTYLLQQAEKMKNTQNYIRMVEIYSFVLHKYPNNKEALTEMAKYSYSINDTLSAIGYINLIDGNISLKNTNELANYLNNYNLNKKNELALSESKTLEISNIAVSNKEDKLLCEIIEEQDLYFYNKKNLSDSKINKSQKSDKLNSNQNLNDFKDDISKVIVQNENLIIIELSIYRNFFNEKDYKNLDLIVEYLKNNPTKKTNISISQDKQKPTSFNKLLSSLQQEILISFFTNNKIENSRLIFKNLNEKDFDSKKNSKRNIEFEFIEKDSSNRLSNI